VAIQTEVFTPAAVEGSPRAHEAVDPRRWQALWFILLASFMDILDGTVVTLAIPYIQRDLGATYADMQWVVASYQLAFAAVLITGGRLGDMFGRKRLFIGGVVGFIATSALAGLAQSPTMLIASRVLQGAVGGLMVPQVLALMQAGFSPRERGAAFGAYGAVLGLGNVAGPLIAGVLLQANLLGLTWRPTF
jgi:MFS family permease